MKIKYTTILFITAALLLNACQKDLDEFVPDPGQLTGPDTSWYATVTPNMPVAALRNSLLLQPSADSFDVNNSPATLLFPSGLQCAFPPNSFIGNTSLPVSGRAELETFLLTRKGDMVRMGVPTVSDGKLLVSGGAIFLRARSNGTDLQLAQSVRVNIHYPDPAPSPLMKIYNGDESNPQQFNWIKNYDTLNCNVMPGNQRYEVMSKNLRWINCAYLYDSMASRTYVSAALPAQYTNSNTIVYMVFNNMRSVVAMYGNTGLHKFTSSAVPLGEPVKIIAISKQGDDYFMGEENIIISGGVGTNMQVVPVMPHRSNLAAVKQYLNTL